MIDITTRLTRIRHADQGRPRKEVTILGAGMAGLTAAVELWELGHKIRILEGSRRVGGRVLTHRFATGYGELGAMRIASHHDYTRHYVARLGLTLRPFVTAFENIDAYFNVRGVSTRMRTAPCNLYPFYPLSRVQQVDARPVDMIGRAIEDVIQSLTDEECAALLEGDMATEGLRELDRTSIREFFRVRLGQGAAELASATTMLDQLLDRAATTLICDALHSARVPSTVRGRYDEIVGGMDLLPRGLAALVDRYIECGAVVRGIDLRSDGRIDLAVSRHGASSTVETCDVVLCTLPFGVLRRLPILSGLGPEKMRAIRLLTYESAIKVVLHCSERFWETAHGIYGGASMTDHVIGAIGYPSDNVIVGPALKRAAEFTSLYAGLPITELRAASIAGEGPQAGVLVGAYAFGQNARRLGVLTESERRTAVMRGIERLHPEIMKPGVVDDSVSVFWDSSPWSGGGAFAYFSPGEMTDLLKAAQKAQGSLHFAGEHCSVEHAWIQGAVRSALQAVEEIVSR